MALWFMIPMVAVTVGIGIGIVAVSLARGKL